MRHGRALLIGRFQPFHRGHAHAVLHALARSDRVFLGIGSSNRSMEAENPFTAAERRRMITGSLDASLMGRIDIYEIPDLQNHVRWVEMIESMLPPFDAVFTNDGMTARLYAQRGVSVFGIPFLGRDRLSGTEIRRRLYAGQPWRHLVPAGTMRVIEPVRRRLQDANAR